jgi:hypothetical protein
MAKRNTGKGTRSRSDAHKRAPAHRLGKRPSTETHLGRPLAKVRTRPGTKKVVQRSTGKVAQRSPKKVTPRVATKVTPRIATKVTPRIATKVAPRIATKVGPLVAKKVGKSPRLDRARRRLNETVPTPPSSLDMDRRGSAVRTGRAEMEETLREHRGMSPDIAAGDVDVDVENAYFSGDEAPGGDNTTPDQEVVDDIGKALGVEYQDAEELKGSTKVEERDRHRWELDPASAEDYKDRD